MHLQQATQDKTYCALLRMLQKHDEGVFIFVDGPTLFRVSWLQCDKKLPTIKLFKCNT